MISIQDPRSDSMFLLSNHMGYSNLRTVDEKTQSRLIESLQILLDECNCRNLEIWSENIVASAQFQSVSNEEKSLYCIDEENDLIFITFPAILDLEGEYSRVRPYFSLEDYGKVSIYIYMSFIFILMIEKIVNPSTLEATMAIFQLLPLSNCYMNDIPVEIAEWSRVAMNIIQFLYNKIELKLQNCEF
jgi:hypothetical protein